MNFDSKRIDTTAKTGEGGTVSMTLDTFLKAVESKAVDLPPEQREMTSKGNKYKKLCEGFIAYLLTRVFL